MKLEQFLALAFLALATTPPAALLAAPGAPTADLATLTGQLSNDDYTTRETASRKLWDSGAAALPALRKIVEGKDPEAADRAAELILYIGAGVLPDSPEEIKTMVIQFSRSNSTKKLTILRKLTEMGQWRQVLHLAKLEKNAATRQKMADLVRKNAGDAARKAIVAGDHQLATEVLELIGDSDQALVMRAWYYKQRGQLAAQLAAAEKMPGKKGNRWRLALHRADGNAAAALKEARALGDTKLAAALQLILGDPIPWLLADISPTQRLDPIPDLSHRIQIAHLRGKKNTGQTLARELPALARDEETNRRVINALAGSGYRDLAIDLMIQREPLTAFIYFDNMESPERALEMLGIPRNASAPYTDWVKKQTSQALEDDDYNTYNKLIILASFLARHGERQHSLTILKPLMDALQKDGSDAWFDLVYTMAIYDLGKEALHLVEQRGNEDGEADTAIGKIFRIIPEASVAHIWEALKKRNNNKLGNALRQIGLLSGMIQGDTNEIKTLHDALLAAPKDDPDIDEAVRITALFAFAETRGDLDTCAATLALKAPGDETWMKAKNYYDKELFRWELMERHYATLVKENPGDYRSVTRHYIALRKQGKDNLTKGMLDRILLLTMGDAAVIGAVGTEFYKVGFYKEGTELWLQTLFMAEPGGREFDSAIESLTEYPQHLYDSAQWSLSAALAEAGIKLQIRGNANSSINDLLRTRFKVEFARGMALLKQGKRTQALATLDAARKLVPGDGTLADHFFPFLRKAGIGKIYEQWFRESYRQVARACTLYPGSHNSQNTAAWLCSRSVRKLDAALAHSTAALKERPHQGAYLDTMAEVWFAQGNRAKAIEWSQKAVADSRRHAQSVFRMRKYVFENYQQLHHQLDRFKTGPLPE